MTALYAVLALYYVVSRVAIYRYAGFLQRDGEGWDSFPVLIFGWIPLIGEGTTFLTYRDRRERGKRK